MSFLDEVTIVSKTTTTQEIPQIAKDEKTTPDTVKKAIDTAKKTGKPVSVAEMIDEANAFLTAADAARDAGKKEFEFPKGSGKIHKVTIKRDLDLEEGKLSTALGGVAVLAGLLLMNKINSNDPVIQRLQAEYEQANPAQQDSIQNLMTKRLLFLDTGKADAGTPMKEDATDTIVNALFGKSYDRPFSGLLDKKGKLKIFNKSDDKFASEDEALIKKMADIEKGNLSDGEFKSVLKKLKKAGMSNKELEALEKRFNNAKKEAMKEAKTIELPADTTFTLDLKHLMQKHLDEGKSQEDVVKLTKALMKKLHDKGEVTVKGTKVIFKENQDDTQLALPEPPARDYLGDDGKDYEGGMAKSQLLKMKKYATALCDMVDDESQLEAWVQAKLTKASEYMSAVYHYLDYQASKMNEDDDLGSLNMMDTDEALVSILMSEANLSEETAEQVVDGLSGENFKKAGLMMVRGVDERQIAKFVLSATTLDENINPKDIDWEDIEPDVENRPDYKEGTIYGTSADGRQWAAHGSYSEFDGYQVIGDLEKV